MDPKLFFYFLGITSMLCGCTSKPSVSALCETDGDGSFILKWEIYPENDNIPVEIFTSVSDSIFLPSLLMTAKSNDFVALIKDSMNMAKRRFFQIKVGGTLSNIISNRFFNLDSVQNFRDIGGYLTENGRQIRWGKIFRSGGFENMTTKDRQKIEDLGIKTLIDIRSQDTRYQYLGQLPSACYIRVPIGNRGYSSIVKQIENGHFMRGDAIVYNQDKYKEMVDNNGKDFALLFDYLCDEDNYPIVLHSYLGKDQADLSIYFILKALGVSSDVIEDDYLESNQGVDKLKLMRDADDLSESGQEALSALIMTDISYLRYGISCMRNRSGSVDEYMTKELKLTPQKRKRLQEILLY